MRIVLDTNVFVSGVFFTGPPYQILAAWRDDRLDLVLSSEILAEYQKVGEELGRRFPEVDLSPLLTLVALNAAFVEIPDPPPSVCDDPDDDKFVACAIAANCHVIVSGDKHLLRLHGHRGISVLSPRRFVDHRLSNG